MASELIPESGAARTFQTTHVWLAAAAFLILGLAGGYLLTGSPAPLNPALAASSLEPSPHPPGTMDTARMPTFQEMKRMADKQAEPLLARLKADPKNVALLVQIGATYHIAHQFRDAAGWYDKALQIEPGNAAVRTRLASSLYRDGDVNGALAQLNQALKTEPNDANALFDLGMIRLHGKGDAKSAVAAWQQLLKTNPQLSPDRKAAVVKIIADVMTAEGGQYGREGASGDVQKSNTD